jgi:hypothetical protein
MTPVYEHFSGIDPEQWVVTAGAFNPSTETFKEFPISTANALVWQILGRNRRDLGGRISTG